MKKYDICVIGAGPSGYAAAMRAVDYGKKVLLVEKKQIGGAGIHHGALWSKTWWELSREASFVRKHNRAFNLNNVSFDYATLKAEVREAINERMQQMEHHMRNINVSGHLKGTLDFELGHAAIKDKHTIEIKKLDELIIVQADYIILATGSSPRKVDDLHIDEEIVFTSDGLDKLEDFPKSMVIVGAGVIGCEFATIFSNFGKTKVHLIDKGERILPFEDEDVVRVIERNMEAKNVLIHRNSKLESLKIEQGQVQYTLQYTDESCELFRVDKALVAIGRVPNHGGLFVNNFSVDFDQRGIIDTDTVTSVNNIYAVGDITADISLVNVGEMEGRYAIERICDATSEPLKYQGISTIMFLDPEVAGVGMNEMQARQQGLSYKVVTLDYSCIPRAIAMRNTQGFIKIIVTEDLKRILGMRVVGEHASSAIQAVALLISMNKGIDEIADLIHPHPSIIEGIQECARVLLGKSIFKPSVLRSSMALKYYKDGKYTDLL